MFSRAFILILVLTSVSAHAEDTQVRHVRVPLNFQTAAKNLPQEEAPPAPSYLGFGASSWIPSNLDLSSRLSDAQPFERGAIPYLSAQWIGPSFFQGKRASLSPRVGLGFADLKRTGTYDYAGTAKSREQEAYLLPAEFGVEAAPTALSGKIAQAYFGASAMPMVLITARSEFDDGRGMFGLAAKFDVGANFAIGRLAGTQPVLINVELLTTLGRISEGGLNGTGIQAGARFSI